MARFQFTLNSVTCEQPRSAGQYHDAVALLFSVSKPAQAPEPDGLLVAPLGLQGPRYTHLFGPGYTHSLAPNPSTFGPGFDRPWSLEIDLPESGRNRELSIVIVNQRHVKDPYKFTKTVTALALAAGFGAAGGAGLKLAGKGFAAVIAGALSGVAGEGIKKLFEGLFGDWPECAGLVFKRTLTINLSDLEELANPVTLQSEVLDAVPEGCRQPRYTVKMSFKSVESMRLRDPEKVVSRRYVPLEAPAKRHWAGRWSSSISSPWAAVIIEPSVQGLISNRVDGAPAYKVTVTERVRRQGGSTRLLEARVFEPVFAESRRDLPYHGDEIKGEWKGSYRSRVEGSSRGLAVRVRNRSRVEAAVHELAAQGATLTAVDSTAAQLLRSVGSANVLRETWSDALAPFNPTAEFTSDVIEGLVARSVTEPGATLVIPDEQISLRLYTVHETMGDGSVRRSVVMRYSRGARLEATRADFEMAKYRGVE